MRLQRRCRSTHEGRLLRELALVRLDQITRSESPTDQKARTPFGVPRPDGPSQPVLAVHHWVVGHVPLDPEVTSKSVDVCAYGTAFAYPVVLPDSAYTEPMIGADALVPPKTIHPDEPAFGVES